jgi:hypothetical protein
MTRLLSALFAALALLFTPPVTLSAAQAQGRSVAISAFFGQWQGSAMSESEISTYFQLTSRDLDVTIEPAGEGFTVAWTTIQRQKGSTANPTEVNKTTRMNFVPSGRASTWRSADMTDPMGNGYAWASIRGSTLVVNSMSIGTTGAWEMQTYERRLIPEGMELRFSRYADGERVRTAKGRLVKVAR